MTFEEFIIRPKNLADAIETAEAQLLALKEGSKCSSPKNDGMPESQSHRSWTEDYTIRIEEKKQQVAELKERQERAYAELGLLFSQMTDKRYIKILVMHYLERMTFDGIALKLKYSIQHVFRLHSEGLKAAKKIYQEQETLMRGR